MTIREKLTAIADLTGLTILMAGSKLDYSMPEIGNEDWKTTLVQLASVIDYEVHVQSRSTLVFRPKLTEFATYKPQNTRFLSGREVIQLRSLFEPAVTQFQVVHQEHAV